MTFKKFIFQLKRLLSTVQIGLKIKEALSLGGGGGGGGR